MIRLNDLPISFKWFVRILSFFPDCRDLFEISFQISSVTRSGHYEVIYVFFLPNKFVVKLSKTGN